MLLPLLLVVAACSAPPQKEIDRAQGGIDAARAAGAEKYASAAFGAATSALEQAHDAVRQRDYRLALTRALDANDRAQEAARGAADGKARARGEAERAMGGAVAVLRRLQDSLTMYGARVGRRDADAARRTHRDAESALQEARAALSAGNYLAAKDAVKDLDAKITAQIQALETASASKPVRPPKRLRLTSGRRTRTPADR
ncbi:MAG: DUF4398 domain-containing protein [Acidobacteria bacterium]|nr:DUF4398 domain-containing protein [Acidobacteriota bacterium]